MKAIEFPLWIVGAMLLALFAGKQAWGESERQHDVDTFAQAQEQLAPVTDVLESRPDTARRAGAAATEASETGIGPATGEAGRWPASADVVPAVLRTPGIALEVPVSYGTDEWVLLRGAGLVEGTARPGSHGNVTFSVQDRRDRPIEEVALDPTPVRVAYIDDRATPYSSLRTTDSISLNAAEGEFGFATRPGIQREQLAAVVVADDSASTVSTEARVVTSESTPVVTSVNTVTQRDSRPATLPSTASSLPWFGLAGLLSMIAGLGLTLLYRS